MNQDDAYSAQSIRRRLLLLLLRAFGIVVFLTVLLILIASTIVIARSTGGNPIFRTPTAIVLETYYLGHGSWQGVEVVLGRAHQHLHSSLATRLGPDRRGGCKWNRDHRSWQYLQPVNWHAIYSKS